MNRRHFLAAAAAALALSATPARANYIDDIVDWLAANNFTDISVTQTLLGRMVIRARLGERVREIACNPRTGEILRDVWLDGGGRPPALPREITDDDHDDDDHDGRDDDDDDADRDDDHSGSGKGDDDDNSGHGSSNSGHGGKSGHGGGDDD